MAGGEEGPVKSKAAFNRRAERLEAALRANLKRRKKQARARASDVVSRSRQDDEPSQE